MHELKIVTYTGPFGYLKPWTAVRDGETYSQQFLTPSVIEGMRQKLSVAQILRHRLSYDLLDMQQEVVHARAWKRGRPRNTGVLTRGILVNPTLRLAFGNEEDARRAACQHLCLCRNEDLVFPQAEIKTIEEVDFDRLDGFELRFEAEHPAAFPVGYNRFAGGELMRGWLQVGGRPVRLAGR
ncbi:hypothetical protein [Hymenobacter psoromatis]|uniref:hypothetical protein n=1 Tax=Hymenobacter psoromatis TaxID=1484116 RepID=UPI001CC179BB|nr:hypothetical protein [Hymenobacter psoromatis]